MNLHAIFGMDLLIIFGRKLFAKVLGREMSWLTAWRVPESLGWPTKCKNVKIWPNNMTFRTDKDLKTKNFRGKKVCILAKDIDSKRKFEIKAKKFRLEKGLFFWDTLIQAVVSKTLRLFYKIFSCLQNISTLNYSHNYEPRWTGGAMIAPHRPFRL